MPSSPGKATVKHVAFRGELYGEVYEVLVVEQVVLSALPSLELVLVMTRM